MKIPRLIWWFLPALCLWQESVVAQQHPVGNDGPRIILSEWQDMLKQTIDSSVFLLRQDYSLRGKKSGRHYGQGNLPYFGRIYTIGVKISPHLIYTDSRLLTPEKFDTSFTPFAGIDSLEPVRGDFALRSIPEKDFHAFHTLSYDANPETRHLIFLSDSSFHTSYLPEGNDTLNAGWLVLFYARNDAHQDPDSLLTVVIKTGLNRVHEPFPGCYVYKPDKFSSRPNLLGGVFVQDEVKNGNVKILVKGVLYYENKQWLLNAFPPDRLPLEDQSGGQSGKLTPIKK